MPSEGGAHRVQAARQQARLDLHQLRVDAAHDAVALVEGELGRVILLTCHIREAHAILGRAHAILGKAHAILDWVE
eukprot:3935069-Prymnesium_polylepis.2